MTDEDEVFAAAQREGKRRAEERRTAETLWDSARRLMVDITCPVTRCTPAAVAAWVHDSAQGPLLRVAYPADDAREILDMNKVLRDLDPEKIKLRVTEEPRRKRDLRRGEQVPYHVVRFSRLLEPEGSPAEDWTSQEVHCHHHGRLLVTRAEVLGAVVTFRHRATVRRAAKPVLLQATITHSGGRRR